MLIENSCRYPSSLVDFLMTLGTAHSEFTTTTMDQAISTPEKRLSPVGWLRERVFLSAIPKGCGIVLAIAALLKFYSVSQESSGSNIYAILVAPYEAILAVLLFRYPKSKGVIAVAIGTFCVFATVSTFKLLNNEATCGCFGQVQTPPWVSFTIAFTGGLLLLLHAARATPVSLSFFAFACAPILVYASFGIALSTPATSTPKTLTYSNLDFGTKFATGKLSWEVPVTNKSNKKTAITKIVSPCSCVVVPKRVDIPANATVKIPIELDFFQTPKPGSRFASLQFTSVLEDGSHHTWDLKGRVECVLRPKVGFPYVSLGEKDNTTLVAKMDLLQSGATIRGAQVDPKFGSAAAHLEGDLVNVRFTPGHTIPVGTHRIPIDVLVNSPKDGEGVVTIYAALERTFDVVCSPRVLVVSSEAGAYSETLMFQSLSNSPFKVKPKNGDPRFEITSRENQSGTFQVAKSTKAATISDSVSPLEFEVNQEGRTYIVQVPVQIVQFRRIQK